MITITLEREDAITEVIKRRLMIQKLKNLLKYLKENIKNDVISHDLEKYILTSNTILYNISQIQMKSLSKEEEILFKELYKYVYIIMKAEIANNIESTILNIIKSNSIHTENINQFIKNDLEEIMNSSFIWDVQAYKRLESLKESENNLMNLEVIVNILLCINKKDIEVGLTKLLIKYKKELENRISNLNESIKADRNVNENQQNLAILSHKIKRLIENKRRDIKGLTLTVVLLISGGLLIPKLSTSFSKEYDNQEIIYEIDEENKIKNQSHVNQFSNGSEITLIVYDSSGNKKEYKISNQYNSLETLVEEETKARNIENQHIEIKVVEKDYSNFKINKEEFSFYCLVSYVILGLLGITSLEFLINDLLECKNGIDYLHRKIDSSINEIENTITEYLKEICQNEELKKKFMDVLNEFDLPIDKEVFISKIEEVIAQNNELKNYLETEQYRARIYRKCE